MTNKVYTNIDRFTIKAFLLAKQEKYNVTQIQL